MEGWEGGGPHPSHTDTPGRQRGINSVVFLFFSFFFSPEPSIKHFILVPAEREQIIPVPTRQVRLVDLNRAKTPRVLDLDIHAPGE